MIARHAMVHPIASVLPAGLGCLWVAAALSQAPAHAAGVLTPGQPTGFGSPLPGQPTGFGPSLPGQPSGYDSSLPGQSSGFGTTQPGQPSGFGTQPGQPGGSGTTASGESGESAQPTSDENPVSDLGSTLLKGLKLSGSLASYYNSNLSPYPIPGNNSAKDDFIASLGGTANYLSKASDFTFGASYRGNYNEYFNHSDFSGYSQGGSVVANYNGGRFSISGSLGASLDRGNNVNYSSAFVEQTTWSSNLTARYRLSPKTSLQADFSQVNTSATGNYSDTSSLSLDASALWRYSPLTEFGPGIRYTYRSGSTQIGRSSIGPIVSFNYRLSEKVALNSRVGVDFASYDNGGSANPTVSASVGLNYQASRLWGMDFTLYRDTQADPFTAGAYTELTSLRLGYHRKILRALWNLGVSYQTNSAVAAGNSSAVNYPTRDYFSADTSLSMLIFANTTTASVFLQFNDQNNGSAGSWNSVLTGVSLSRSF